MRNVWVLTGFLLGLGVAHAQPVCVKPSRIPAIREALQAPAESAVDRTGPWELSRPVAMKYGLKWQGVVDERLDSSCAQYASEQQWKTLFARYNDSVLADIAVAVSPAFAVRTAKKWAADPCAQERDVAVIQEVESRTPLTGKAGWSRAAILQAHLEGAALAVQTEMAPVLSEQALGTIPVASPAVPSPSLVTKPTTPVAATPPQSKSAPQKVRYVVKNGDSLWKIAQKFPTTSEADLIRLNKGKTTIYPGQILWIPL